MRLPALLLGLVLLSPMAADPLPLELPPIQAHPQVAETPQVETPYPDGVLPGPPMPQDIEWLDDAVRREFRSAFGPIQQSVEKASNAFCRFFERAWQIVKITFYVFVGVVILLVIGVLFSVVLSFKVLAAVWSVPSLVSAAIGVLRQIQLTQKGPT